MGRTKRFSLSRFGGSDGGSLSDDGFKFANRDRNVLDAILAAYETHNHTGGEKLPDPTGLPGLTTLTEGGALAGGRTYFYRVSFIDKYGLETAASGESAIATPAPVEPPGAPVLISTSTASGSLVEGVYEYALTAETAEYETQLGGVAVITLLSDRNAIALQMPALPTGASSFGIWRKGPNASGYTKIGSTTASTTVDEGTVPDDPCACDPDKLPPQENRTNSSNIVTITAPTFPEGTKAWRIYRTTSSGAYGPSTLVAEVAELDDLGDLVTFYVDDGTQALDGGPLEISQTLNPSIPAGGGGSGSGALFLGGGGYVHQLYATLDGVLVTRLVTTPAPGDTKDRPIVLTDVDGGIWRTTTTAAGELTTELIPSTHLDAPLAHKNGEGPHVGTSEATLTFQLDVATDGALVTRGTREDARTEELRLRPVAIEPPTPVEGGVFYVIDGELRFKFSNAKVVTIAAATP